MFIKFLTWLRSLVCGKKEEPVSPPRLDEFHKATFQELFEAAWTLVAGVPPPGSNKDRKSYLERLHGEFGGAGAHIEFNEQGLGRVLPGGELGSIDISMANLPVRVRWDPSKMCLRPNEAESRRFAVRLMNGEVPQAGGTESSASSPSP